MLGAVLLGQESSDVQKKWGEVRAVWSHYVGVTVETGSYRGHMRTATFLRDGRFLIEVEPYDYAIELDLRQHKTVDYFDGERRIQYDALTNEYVILQDHKPPNWLYPFLLLWGNKSVPWSPTSFGEDTDVHFDSYEDWYTLAVYDSPPTLMLFLRSHDLTPMTSVRFPVFREEDIEIQDYSRCLPILYQGHAEWAVEWSLPPGAKLVDKLNSHR